jgi:hypothetical protein
LNELAPQLIRALTAIKTAHNRTEERAVGVHRAI